MNITDFDPLDERYRWCIYCQADCWPDEPDHAETCPSVTGVFPITAEDLEPHGMKCMDCGHLFAVGDSWTRIDVTEQGDPIPVMEIVCVGCKAAHELLGAERRP